MELRHLRYFVAVAEEQNITRAAARLHVSQPPLSRQIRDLEDEVGAALFERSARAVRLTPAGWAFLEECYAVLRQLDRAVRVAQATARGMQGEVNLGYAPGPTQELLRELLKVWRKAEPGIRVLLHDLTTKEMLDGLRGHRLHVALMIDPGSKLGRGIAFTPLRADQPLAAVAHEHPLARRRVVSVADLVRERFVIFSRSEYPEYHDSISAVLGAQAAQLRVAEECDSGMSLIAAVESAQGVAILSRSLRPTIGRRLKLIPIEPPPPPTVVGIARLARTREPLVPRLVEAALTLARPIR